MTIIVVLMYSCTFLYLCEFTLAIVNTWKFLIKQKKYKTWPLLAFYLLTIWLSLSEAHFNIFFFKSTTEQKVYELNMRPILKLIMGIIQCWMLFELALRITQELRRTERISRLLSG